MITHWIVTGDTHGQVELRLENIMRNCEVDDWSKTAVIILGDAGINFYLNKTDKKHKKSICNNFGGIQVYCVRGNHEERPENIETMVQAYDPEVQSTVWYEPEFPNIKYFIDGETYIINGHRTLVIGGAYSVDKYWRLQRAAASGNSFSGWFEGEQLTHEEMGYIEGEVYGMCYDFVFTHTAPICWEPTDLFMSVVDQSTVEKDMEIWLDQIKETFDWGVWCFGHYHADRMERPRVEQYFRNYEDLETIWNRWHGEKTFKNEYWLPKSPAFYDNMTSEEIAELKGEVEA